MFVRKQALFRLLVVSSLIITGLGCAHVAPRTALDKYVAKEDPNYTFSQAGEPIAGEGYKAYVLDMVSQQWRTAEEIDKPIWRHWLIVVKPDVVESNKALLYVTGGDNTDPAPTSVEEQFITIAKQTKSVVAVLTVVPNEPVVFTGDGKSRTEDEITAFTFAKYMTTGDDTWPLFLPMVKSAVRAMDTVQTFLAGLPDKPVNVEQFVVSGGSKRGWTTWLTAAVDPRVVGLIPAVIDILNMDEQMRHHFAAYGFYAPAVKDYIDNGIFDHFDTPEGQKLLKVVDAYEYRTRFTMPKYLVNASCDQFFLPDSAQFYFYDLPAERYLRYVPNVGHGLDNSDVWESILAFYGSIVTGAQRPRFTWTSEEPGVIRVEAQDKPVQVNLWQATNPEARDFRLEVLGPKWASTPLTPEADGTYLARIQTPEKGYTGYFVELVYDSPFGVPYKFTTEIHIVPTTLPFAQADEKGNPTACSMCPKACGSTSR